MRYSGLKKLMSMALALGVCLLLLSVGALAAEEAAVSLLNGGMTLPPVEEEALAAEEPSVTDAAPAEEAPAADAQADGVAIHEKSFPDENFRDYVSLYLDGDQDGILSPGEIEAVIALDCSGCGIGDLTGVEYFTALEYLYCSDNALESLDISGLGALYVLDCSGNSLTELDVSGCGALEELWAQGNEMTELDLTGNPALETRLAAANLTEQGGVESWAGSGNAPLKNDSGVKITLAGGIVLNRGNVPDDTLRLLLRDGIDADGNGYMPRTEADGVMELDCAGWDVADLTGLGLFPNLTRLDCRDTAVATLDLRNVPGLETVYLEGEQIEGDGFFVYVYEETDGVLMVDKGVPVRTANGGADVDRDGDTDTDDALAVLRHTVGTKTITGSGLSAAEVTGDGVVNARDAAQIIRFFNGLPSTIR